MEILPIHVNPLLAVPKLFQAGLLFVSFSYLVAWLSCHLTLISRKYLSTQSFSFALSLSLSLSPSPSLSLSLFMSPFLAHHRVIQCTSGSQRLIRTRSPSCCTPVPCRSTTLLPMSVLLQQTLDGVSNMICYHSLFCLDRERMHSEI